MWLCYSVMCYDVKERREFILGVFNLKVKSLPDAFKNHKYHKYDKISTKS